LGLAPNDLWGTGGVIMIGVIADPSEHDVIQEFFEFFKTPWEFYRSTRPYDVLLCAGECPVDKAAKLVVIYAGTKLHFDSERGIQTGQLPRSAILLCGANRIPIYGDAITFPEVESQLLVDEGCQQCVAYLDRSLEEIVARIGYDLFVEIRKLLTVGQPIANAHMPALELHIAFLRELIVRCQIPLIEIPPVPEGYGFIACLTHDVDHPSIRNHKCDHTMFGFSYRALFGSLRQFITGRIPFRALVRNWTAVLKLPLVYLGFAKDFWREFDDQYLELEKGLRSTFFMIPFKNYPGQKSNGPAPTLRAARYRAADLADSIRKLGIAGCEIGVHGIDGWFDSQRAHLEMEEIRRLTGRSKTGVRMHWLYYDEQSPVVLEKAEAVYDSTIGYNETVGYRAGTTQVYKPLQVDRLLELPMHVMDTALFYPSYLGLSPREAKTLLGELVDNAIQFGGCFTTNWHDRSVSPERLWDNCYRNLLQDLRSRGAWFSTAGEAISWFQKRRSVVFELKNMDPLEMRAKVTSHQDPHLPALRLRIHNVPESHGKGSQGLATYIDVALDESGETRVPCGVSR
jgi:hypothetical protein